MLTMHNPLTPTQQYCVPAGGESWRAGPSLASRLVSCVGLVPLCTLEGPGWSNDTLLAVQENTAEC